MQSRPHSRITQPPPRSGRGSAPLGVEASWSAETCSGTMRGMPRAPDCEPNPDRIHSRMVRVPPRKPARRPAGERAGGISSAVE